MATATPKPVRLPGHLDLPEEDGTFVKNYREHPQSMLLTDAILPVLRRRHPDGHFAIGQDCGIYWRRADPPQRGAEAPDWCYVPGVPPNLEGNYRRSYVLWQELISPLIVLEFASGDGSEERDRTPWSGKFWVYEQVIHAAFYGIFDVATGACELFHLVDNEYQPVAANARGHYPIPRLGVELGTWHGYYLNEQAPWLRWWNDQGNLLLVGDERAEEEHRRAEEERRRAEEEHRRADAERLRAEALAERLRALGIDPDAVGPGPA